MLFCFLVLYASNVFRFSCYRIKSDLFMFDVMFDLIMMTVYISCYLNRFLFCSIIWKTFSLFSNMNLFLTIGLSCHLFFLLNDYFYVLGSIKQTTIHLKTQLIEKLKSSIQTTQRDSQVPINICLTFIFHTKFFFPN